MNQITYHQNNLTYTEQSANIQADPFKNLPSPNLGLSFPVSNVLKLTARKVSFQITTLGQTTQTYTSPLYADMTALANYFSDWSCNYDIQEGPVHTFTATAPWDTMTGADFNISLYASEQWELLPTMDIKPLYANGTLANPFLPPTVGGNYIILPVPVQLAVQNSIENKTIINITSGSYVPWNSVANQIQQYIRMGVEGVPSYTQTLKRTAVIDRNNSNNAFQLAADATRSDLNYQGTVNYILSTKDMIAQYSIPHNTVAKFLNNSYSKLSNPNIDVFRWKTYAGWLVKPPTFNFISRNKVQLTQEFVWNEYLSGIYYIESPASDFPQIIVPTNTPTP
jgi:hypothetical protein